MQLPFVLSIPHCGIQIPSDVKACMALAEEEIVKSADFGTLEIFGHLPVRRWIHAQWSRLLVDLNRSPDQYDPKGVVALTDYDGQTVFRSGCEPSRAEIVERVADYYTPYHRKLAELLQPDDFLALIDCHSLNGTGPADAPDRGRKRADVVLSNFGDAQGQQRSAKEPLTCPADVLQAAASALAAQGFSVSLNTPYRGGFIVNHYGAILRRGGRFAVQIEMNQGLYMRPPSLVPDPERTEAVKSRVMRALSLWAEKLSGQS